MMKLNLRAAGGLVFLLMVMGALLFLPAWTLDYWQGWVFLAVFGASASAITVYLMKEDPALLERRVHGGPTAEKDAGQRTASSIASIGFVAILVVSALDHRARWSTVPPGAAIAGDVLVAVGFAIVFFVFKENPFTSATVEVAPDQNVISTGPYAVVRHPMYSGALVLLLAMPVALGSWWGLSGIALMMPALVWRLLAEESFLAKSLSGYSAYRDK
ncbi:MAG TPA: isoprenylcysteine carboxylmethyltransferase family protein, partial [Candidatus Elarobacter sp.]